MLDLRTDVPIRKEVLDEVQTRFAQIRDLQDEAMTLLAIAVNNKQEVYLTRPEVASMLRCEEKRIPRDIPRCKRGKEYLFSSEDVKNWVKSHKK